MSKQVLKKKLATDNLSKRDTNLFNQMIVSLILVKINSVFRIGTIQNSTKMQWKTARQYWKTTKITQVKILECFCANFFFKETEAFKCLVMTKIKRSKEAFENIKKILFKNLSNFTCWHV